MKINSVSVLISVLRGVQHTTLLLECYLADSVVTRATCLRTPLEPVVSSGVEIGYDGLHRHGHRGRTGSPRPPLVAIGPEFQLASELITFNGRVKVTRQGPQEGREKRTCRLPPCDGARLSSCLNSLSRKYLIPDESQSKRCPRSSVAVMPSLIDIGMRSVCIR